MKMCPCIICQTKRQKNCSFSSLFKLFSNAIPVQTGPQLCYNNVTPLKSRKWPRVNKKEEDK